MSGRHIYHYHATYQPEPGSIIHIDGIALLYGRIANMEDYGAMKEMIAKDRTTADKLVINSLSHIGMEQ